MGFKAFLLKYFKPKQPVLKPLKVERPGIKSRLKAKPKHYVGRIALVYKGKPLREFTVHESGYSRDAVAGSIDTNLSFKLLSVVQDKSKTRTNETSRK